MKAMILKSYGAGAPFELADLPDPQAKPGHVLIRIAATSVNTIDTMLRNLGQENLPFAPDLPALLGMDFAGTVEAVGDDVTDYVVGDEVYGCAGGLADLPGALAERIVADVRLIALKPKTLSMREAAALPLVGITAFEGLTRAGVRAGQKVLVQGGSGGVGHVAIQLAKQMEAEVFATDTGNMRLVTVRDCGATAIDFKAQTVEEYVAAHTGGAGFDVVFDTVGGGNLTNSFVATALNGQVATTVALEPIDLSMAHLRGLSLHVVFMLIPMMHDQGRANHGKILSKIAGLVDEGALRPILDAERFNLADVGAAYAHLTGGQAIGKVVIDV